MTAKNRRKIRYIFFSLIFIAVIFVIPKLRISKDVSALLVTSEIFYQSNSQSLPDEINKLLMEVADLQGIKTENEQLRKLLDFKATLQHKLLTGYIVSREPLNHNFVNINLGSRDGLVVGQPIVVDNGIIIGKILKVDDYKALGELLTSDVSSLVVKDARSGNLSGLIVGTLGSSLSMQYIESTADVQINDLIVTSGTEDFVPPGLVIGTVERIEMDDASVFNTAIIKPAISYDEQRLVAVLVN